MSDIECPYCREEVKINHDDGYGYEEDKTYEQECGHCDKTFVYTTSISFYHEALAAPCLNGEPHKWKKINGYPERYFVNKFRCEWCDKEKTIAPAIESVETE